MVPCNIQRRKMGKNLIDSRETFSCWQTYKFPFSFSRRKNQDQNCNFCKILRFQSLIMEFNSTSTFSAQNAFVLRRRFLLLNKIFRRYRQPIFLARSFLKSGDNKSQNDFKIGTVTGIFNLLPLGRGSQNYRIKIQGYSVTYTCYKNLFEL